MSGVWVALGVTALSTADKVVDSRSAERMSSIQARAARNKTLADAQAQRDALLGVQDEQMTDSVKQRKRALAANVLGLGQSLGGQDTALGRGQ